MKNKRIITGLICITMAVILCICIVPIITGSIDKRISVLASSVTIPKGTVISEEMLCTAKVLLSDIPSGSVEDTVQNRSRIIGKYSTCDIYDGDLIFYIKVSENAYAGDYYLTELNGNSIAMSFSISGFAEGLSGKLMPGDIVSLISSGGIISDQLKYVRLVALTSADGTDISSNDKEHVLPATATVLLTESQSCELYRIKNAGIHIGLVYRGSAENCKKYLDLQTELLKPPFM